MHIACATDERYAPYCAAMLHSALQACHPQQLHIHLLHPQGLPVHSEHWQRDEQLFIAEMGLAQGQSEQIYWGGDVELEIMIRSTHAQQKLRLAYCINDHMGRPVLTGFSENFSMAAGDCVLRLGLHELKLVPGNYDFSLALGTGQIGDFRLERDSFIGFGKLTVLDQLENGQEFGDWPTRWASLIHASSSLRAIGPDKPLETLT